MSNIIPPLLSNTPPPIIGPLDEEDDDEFGDFRAAHELSYSCDNLSLPSSPFESPKKNPLSIPDEVLDINSNTSKGKNEKDFHDRRKEDQQQSEDAFCTKLEPSCNDFCKVENHINSDFNGLEIVKQLPVIESKLVDSNQDDAILSKSLNMAKIDDKVNEEVIVSDSEVTISKDAFAINDNISLTTKESADELEHFERPLEDRNISHSFDDIEEKTVLENGCDDSLSLSDGNEDISKTSEPNSNDNLRNVADDNSKHSSDVLDTNELTNEDDNFDDFVKPPDKLELKSVKDQLFCLTDPSENKDQDNVGSESRSLECTDEDSDSFADFESPADLPNTVEINDSEDEFGNFESPVLENVPKKVEKGDQIDDCDGDDDFGDFAAASAWGTKEEGSVEFADFSNASTSDDNFGNFADFSEATPSDSTILTLDNDKIFEKTETILKDIFPISAEPPDQVYISDITQNDNIFDELKDVTDTHALIFQWPKSSSQKLLLKSLSIDTRNILYGPAWNSSMPIFAANLGLTPLEPIKPEIITPTPVQKTETNPSSSSQLNTNSEIPSAQFDWNSSGLINPLDSTIEKEAKTKETNTSETHIESTVPTVKAPEFEDFDDFTSFQSNNSQTWSNIVPVPLRETHISNEDVQISKEDKLDNKNDLGWLQPTIVTPELPRKDVVQDEDDFDDFQMVLPADSSESKPVISVNPLQPANVALSSVNTPAIVKKTGNVQVDDFDVFGEFESNVVTAPSVNLTKIKEQNNENISLEPVKTNHDCTTPEMIANSGPNIQEVCNSNEQQANVPIEDKSSVMKTADEDEFTDFHSSVPEPKPLQPATMEPLKPSILKPQNSTHNQPAQINWPDPGISDEEIKRFEMNFSRPLDSPDALKSQSSLPDNIPKKKDLSKTGSTGSLPKPPQIPSNLKNATKPVSKENSLDDDDWSDFVSVKQPSPLHKLNIVERTASPDLPLSVLNLGNIQPARQPIPVITPQGLVQTKLSSNPGIKPMQNNYYSLQKSSFTPSLISTQYPVSQIYNGNSQVTNNFSTASTKPNTLDDDDWSDFVSGPAQTNGFVNKSKMQPFPNPPPNIITNPSHVLQSSKNSLSDVNKIKNSNVQSMTTVSSITTLPDLDFIAPRGWTNRK